MAARQGRIRFSGEADLQLLREAVALNPFSLTNGQGWQRLVTLLTTTKNFPDSITARTVRDRTQLLLEKYLRDKKEMEESSVAAFEVVTERHQLLEELLEFREEARRCPPTNARIQSMEGWVVSREQDQENEDSSCSGQTGKIRRAADDDAWMELFREKEEKWALQMKEEIEHRKEELHFRRLELEAQRQREQVERDERRQQLQLLREKEERDQEERTKFMELLLTTINEEMGRPDPDFACRLVAEVQKRPILYDTAHPEYKDLGKKDREWINIAEVMGSSAELIKRKWQNLRGSFSKSLVAANLPSGEAKRATKFYLHDRMAFLTSHINNGSTTVVLDNVGVAENTEEEEEEEEEVEQKYIPDISRGNSPQPSSSSSLPAASAACSTVRLARPFSPSITQHSTFGSITQASTYVATQPVTSYVTQPSSSYGNVTQSSATSSHVTQQPTTSSTSHSQTSKKRKVEEDGVESALISFINMKKENFQAKDPDLAFFTGLLPQIKQLNKKRKRNFFQEVSALLFRSLNEQDEEQEMSNT